MHNVVYKKPANGVLKAHYTVVIVLNEKGLVCYTSVFIFALFRPVEIVGVIVGELAMLRCNCRWALYAQV